MATQSRIGPPALRAGHAATPPAGASIQASERDAAGAQGRFTTTIHLSWAHRSRRAAHAGASGRTGAGV